MKLSVEPKRHDIEAILPAKPGDRVEDDGPGDTGKIDAEQVRENSAAVDPRNERLAVTLNASCLVVEDLTASERPSKHVRVAHQQRLQSVNNDVNSIHHQRHVYLYWDINNAIMSQYYIGLIVFRHVPVATEARGICPKFVFLPLPPQKIVAWCCNGYGVGLAFDRSRVRFPAVPLPSSDPGHVVHTHVPLSPSSTIWYRRQTGQRAVMLCGREGNRRSGVALTMHHRLQWFIHLRAQRL